MKNNSMNNLLKLQLKKIYGKNFDINTKDEKFQKFVKVVEDAYKNYEKEEKLLENILAVNAKELEETNSLLLREQELLKSVEDSMGDAMFYKNLQHQYIGCNKRFAEFLKLNEKDIIGKTDYDLFDEASARKYQKVNEKLIREKTKVSYKQWVEYKGEKYYVLISKTPLINIKGEIIGTVGVSRDITHEYELQKEVEHKNIMLIQQNKLVSMGEMIANIAHQWRQPLNTLGIIVQKMGIEYKLNLLNEKQVDKNISEAMMLMQEMSETIDDFRNFFNPKRVLENFNLHEALLKSYSIIKALITANNIAFKIDIKENYYIYGYKNEFFQVMLNLLSNAIEALIADEIPSPKITIAVTSDEKNKIKIHICDNANGIQNDIIEQIFDPYFTTKDNGTGLGLYMSKIIIEEHMKGEITVINNPFGTTFIITLQGGGKIDSYN